MDIGIPLKELGAIEIDALRSAVLSLDKAAWESNALRQTRYDVHKNTKSIVLLFTTGVGWPDIEVSRESGWDLLSDIVQPIMDGILAKYYPAGGTIVRAMIANLTAGNVIGTHVDKDPSFHAGHRIHVPIVTNRRVRFMIDGKPYQFQVGKVYELNNQSTHSVVNRGKEDRLTLIFDYVPADQGCNPTFVYPELSAD